MTDQEIIRNRMIEIVKSNGYKSVNGKLKNSHFEKVLTEHEHFINIENDNSLNFNINKLGNHVGFYSFVSIQSINLDYEELSLLIDIFNKNYN